MEWFLNEFETFVGVNFWTMLFAWCNLIILYFALRKIEIEKNYDLSNCKILHLECSQRINTLDEYLKFTKLGIENLHMDVNIYLELHSEKELKELLYKCIRDKRVGMIDICYNQNEFYSSKICI